MAEPQDVTPQDRKPPLGTKILLLIAAVTFLLGTLISAYGTVSSLNTQSIIESQTGPVAAQRQALGVRAVECRVIIADRQSTIDSINVVLTNAHAQTIKSTDLRPIPGCTTSGNTTGAATSQVGP